MTDLEPTPERIATARHAATREWTMGAEGTIEIDTNPVLSDMVLAGLIKPHFVSAEAQIAGRSDYYRLTEAGEAWLARAEQESAR